MSTPTPERKPVKNKLDPYRERLRDWNAEGMKLADIVQQLRADGLTTSVSSVGSYLQRMQKAEAEENFFAQVLTGGQMNKELTAAYDANPDPAIERLIQVTKTHIMSLQVHGATNPKLLSLSNSMLQTVLNFISAETKAKHKREELDLARDKYRDHVEERKRVLAAEIKAANTSGGLSEEARTRIERELNLL